ncbi:zf-HC2 domain-containing protein [Paenibacillus alginolyticus]|uniref:anti-sigma factor family protein n=1 Tax=Paenibacillus alginolyticus TaxID=59839 RepID=UPI0004050AC5|nr:zf-HC2 domain-containing protein [Paenibacillus alginolyticus]MCY9669857.1 zf-HC2 domain-containing protein [Paenibacillus alginolyticus]
MINHPDDILSAYIDNELNDDENRILEEHLAYCEQCQTLYEDLLHLKFQASSAFQDFEAPVDLEQRIMNEINLNPAAKPINKAWVTLPVLGILTVLIVLILSGPVFVTLISILFKFIAVLVFVIPSVLTSVPSLFGASIIFSIFMLIFSSFYLRRLLQTNMNGRG